MKYNINFRDGDDERIQPTQQMLTTSGFTYRPAPKTPDELKKDALRALAAWQGALKAAQDEQATLDGLLADLAAQMKAQKGNEEIDAAIRKEWLERAEKEKK